MKTKLDILTNLEDAFSSLNKYAEQLSDTDFFKLQNNKWNAAQQIEHLAWSHFITNSIFSTPKSVLKLLYKINQRTNFSYEDIKLQYQQKLATGSKSAIIFHPKLTLLKKRNLINSFSKSAQQKLLNNLKDITENDLDLYLVPHPIIGKITIREMMFFTIYHNEHHLKSIQSLV